MKKILLTIAILSFGMAMFAAPVSESTAAMAALNFYKSRCEANVSAATLAYKASDTRSGNADFYAFNIGEGFVIVAGDDRVRPILAYSDESSFDSENIPEHVAFFLNEYVREMEAVIHSCANDEQTLIKWNKLINNELDNTKDGVVVVGPLLTDKWSQLQYYNSLCPADANASQTGGHALVGCGALVMGQVMRYWKYPENGIGSHSYTSNNAAYGNGYGDYGVLSADFGNTTYDFANMPKSLTSTTGSAKITATATLLYHCGVSVDMRYGINASMSNSNNIVPAFSTYFGYPATITYKERSYYTDAQWWNFIKGELDDHAPFLYGGSGSYGGHVFVCDGYRDDDFIHLNWGWGGGYNGYYSIDAFNPGPYDFNSNHSIIYGIRGPQLPESIADNGNDELRIYPNPTSGQLNIEWQNGAKHDRQLLVTDLTGRTVYRSIIPMDETNCSINVSNLAKGIYLLNLINGEQKTVKKFVVD